jgi:hypothetical protein
MRNAHVSILFAAAALFGGAAAEAACPSAQTRDCVINLDAVPQISQQIVATAPAAPSAKPAVGATPAKPYTGPTLGLTPTVRQYPTVGYRWSFD